MPDNIPETGDVVIHSSGSHETQSPFVRFRDRTSSVAQPVRRLNGWRGRAPSALESSVVFRGPQRLHAAGSLPGNSTSTAPANAHNGWCARWAKAYPSLEGIVRERICVETAQKAPRR
jgi:hypothetical protein